MCFIKLNTAVFAPISIYRHTYTSTFNNLFLHIIVLMEIMVKNQSVRLLSENVAHQNADADPDQDQTTQQFHALAKFQAQPPADQQTCKG